MVFNQMPSNLGLSYDSYGFQANKAKEFGNYVQLDGTERFLTAVTVTMVTWAKQSDYSSLDAKYTNSAGWNHYVEAVIYAVDNSGAAPVLNYITSSGGEVLIPWRPTTVPSGYPEAAGSNYPYNGFAFNLTFQFNGSVQLPNQLVVAVSFDTQDYGWNPINAHGPYDKLNVAAPKPLEDPDYLDPSVGVDLSPYVYQFQLQENGGYDATLNSNSGGGSPFFRIEASSDAYTVWIVSYGFTAGGVGALRSDDPDGDGLNNLTEFAFGTDPGVNTQSPISIEQVSSTQVKVSFLLRNDGSMEYNPRSSTSLDPAFSSWLVFTPSASSDQTGLPRDQYTRYEQVLDSGSLDRAFVKIEAQEPTP